MIKVYFDWNVIAQMKNGQHSELKEIAVNNERLFIPFSTSHIGDIFSSYNENEGITEYINSDLQFISELTKNLCFFNNGKGIALDYYPPKELFQSRINDNPTLENCFDEIGKTCSELGVQNPYDIIKSLPLDFGNAFDNPENANQMDLIFPELKDNQTFGGFFESFSKMINSWNNDEKYKDARQMVQSGLGVKRDKIFNSDNPYKQIEQSYQKLNINLTEFLKENENNKNAPKWFNDITNEYLLLDMHGYQEDKVNTQKGRKETFKNTTEDAFHAAFASMCNFYVTNDNKSYNKTKQVYGKLQINTYVLKPDEFLEYYKKYLNINDKQIFVQLIFALLEKGEFVENKLDDALLKTCYFPYFIFDFFNKLMILMPDNSEDCSIILSQNMHSNGGVYSMEITKLVSDICEVFGKDIDELGEIREEEFMHEEEWIGRKWKFENIIFKLIRLNRRFQLYLLFDE